MHLAEQEQSQIIGLVAEFEAKSGTEVLVSVVGNADAYPEIPWKAFALGAALAALLVVLAGWLLPEWRLDRPAVVDIATVLGAGAVCGLLAMFVPYFARLFLDPLRAEAEVRQHAQAMFLERGVFQTRDRTGLLLMISLLEHRIVIPPDAGLRKHLSALAIQSAIAGMAPLLARRQIAAAVAKGLGILAQALRAAPLRTRGSGNEIPDAVVQEKGA